MTAVNLLGALKLQPLLNIVLEHIDTTDLVCYYSLHEAHVKNEVNCFQPI